MSTVGYFSVEKNGETESPVRRLLRLQEERTALAAAQKARLEGGRREVYEEVEDYDPVLRWHCRV